MVLSHDDLHWIFLKNWNHTTLTPYKPIKKKTPKPPKTELSTTTGFLLNGWMDGWTDGQNFFPFYRTSSPFGAATQMKHYLWSGCYFQRTNFSNVYPEYKSQKVPHLARNSPQLSHSSSSKKWKHFFSSNFSKNRYHYQFFIIIAEWHFKNIWAPILLNLRTSQGEKFFAGP